MRARAAIAVGIVASLALGMAGATVQAIAVGPTVNGSFIGFPYDRVSATEGPGSLEPDSGPDALYSVTVALSGSHTITRASVVAGGSIWDTEPDNGMWVLGITDPSAGAAFLNAGDADASIPFTDSRTFYFYMADNGSQAAGGTFDVTVCLSDGTCGSTQVTSGADNDGDGWQTPTDCDDTEASINPGAAEVPDNFVDENCDGAIDLPYYVDDDGDGYGTGAPVGSANASNPAPEGHSFTTGDCDDGDAAINPDAAEVSGNSVDENCDGVAAAQSWYPDNDDDGYGDPSGAVEATEAPPGYVANNTDCDDTDKNINPGAADTPYNEVDEDCGGADDRDWFEDADGDFFGNPDSSVIDDSPPEGYRFTAGDCDDTESGINPLADEVPDNDVDEDCDGADAKTWYADADADGYGGASTAVANSAPPGHVGNDDDCDDTDEAIKPGADEVPDNDVDEDCDGADAKTWYADADADGYGGATSAVANTALPGHVGNDDDCDDTSEAVHPGAGEAPDNNVDEDCDGFDLKNWWADGDSDGYGSSSASTTGNTAPLGYVDNSKDCDDGNAAIKPGAAEVVGNDVDEDCDGFDAKLWHPDFDSDSYGDSSLGTVSNELPPGHVADGTDCNDGDASIKPGATEVPDNGVDENCDGADAKTWHPDGDSDGYGSAKTFVSNEAPPGFVADGTDCDDGSAAVHPGATEVVGNNVDEDCNGFDQKLWFPDSDADGYGAADYPGFAADTSPSPGYITDGTDCDDGSAAVYPGAPETPNNNVDEDCDGADLVVGTNHAPVALDNAAQVDEDDAAGVYVVMQATDEDGDDLTLTITGGPSNGTLDPLDPVDCFSFDYCFVTLHYTPGPDFSGVDTITFSATDPSGASSAVDGVITITVNPTAEPTSFGPVTTSNGYFTNKGERVTVGSTVLSPNAACVARRMVTVTITGGTLSAPLVYNVRSSSLGAFSVQPTLQPGTYSVALSTPAVGDCAAASSSPAGTFVIKSAKKPK